MTPKEALSRAADLASFIPRTPAEGRTGGVGVPGLFLGRMSPRILESLSRLTSDDALEVDADWVVKGRV